MKLFMQKILNKQPFSKQESYTLFQKFYISPVEQQAGILALLQANKYTADLLLGARQYLFEQTTKINPPYELIDIVGTGGDNIGTFNISTAASLIVASCGVNVAKHGGRSVTSQSGSADVLEKLKIPTPTNEKDIQNYLAEHHFVYLSAALFNPLLQQFKQLRKNLSIPSIFNLLGPLLNPLSVKRAVIGVYDHSLIKPMVETLQQLGFIHALVIHSFDGLDEFSISAPTHVAELKNNHIKYYTVKPQDLGFEQTSLDAVLGGSASENAKTIMNILSNNLKGPKLDIVLLNAAAGLLVANKAPDLISGIQIAKLAIETYQTKKLLEKLQSQHQEI